jgi:hypothetical protein
MLDARSPLAVKVINDNPRAYESLVVEGGTPALTRTLLDGVQPEQLLAAPGTSLVAAYAMLAGLWLWHDGLNECHEIVQKSPEDLRSAALNLHSKSSETSPKVGSAQFVENDKASDKRYLQDMTSTLAFWHAIMHRREGDFSNSKYWYRQTGAHPAMPVIAAQAGPIVGGAPADIGLLKVVVSGWNPMAFVDYVESAHRGGDESKKRIARELQVIEWRTLFDYCVRA